MEKSPNSMALAATVFSILAMICISIAFFSLFGQNVFGWPIKLALPMTFIILGLILPLPGIILGRIARERFFKDKSNEGSELGAFGIIGGFIAIGMVVMIIVGTIIQGGFTFTAAKEEAPAVDVGAQIEQARQIATVIQSKARSYMQGKDEFAGRPSVAAIGKKYDVPIIDPWSNEIVLKVYQRKDDFDFFEGWGASAYSKGPDGEDRTDDDVKP